MQGFLNPLSLFWDGLMEGVLEAERKNLKDYLSTFLSNVFAASLAAFSWQTWSFPFCAMLAYSQLPHTALFNYTLAETGLEKNENIPGKKNLQYCCCSSRYKFHKMTASATSTLICSTVLSWHLDLWLFFNSSVVFSGNNFCLLFLPQIWSIHIKFAEIKTNWQTLFVRH